MVVMVLHLTTLFSLSFSFSFSFPKSNHFLMNKKDKNRKRKEKYDIFNLAPQKKVTARFLPILPTYLPTYSFSFWYEMRPCLFPEILEGRIYLYLYLPYLPT